MKVMFLGSLISREEMERLNEKSTEKASIAPVNYENMLVKGLYENGIEVDVLSIPAIAAYPRSAYKSIKKKKECIENGINITWIPFINIQLIKQWTIYYNSKKALAKWLKENQDIKDKVVLMYSVYPPYTKAAIHLCQKYGCHLSAVITDLPEYMYSWKKSKGLRGIYSIILSNQMKKLQDRCDSYILFTKYMAERMNILKKPFLVSEGFSDNNIYKNINVVEKYNKKTILYGGNLSNLYGIKNLIKAFMLTNIDVEFHLYGSGIDEEYIKICSQKDSRIKYMGRVSRDELLLALKKAHLLVINKPTKDDYSKYSFSSKILEYMLSGTPVLTTRVGGMPEEYYKYLYFIDDESIKGISKTIEKYLELPLLQLEKKGNEAALFAKNKKNYKFMTKSIISFLEKVMEKK